MTIFSIIVFLTILTLLVAAHEYGHYLFARIFKMGVEEFAIGMGRPYWVYRRKKYKTGRIDENGNEIEEVTEFTLRPLPLGGFVRPKGSVPEEDGSEVNIPGGFYSKPPLQRFLVYFAGPVFSVLAGWAILIPTYAIAGDDVPSNKPVLGYVGPDGAAGKAGLKEGDKIIAVDGKPINTFYDIISTVRDMPAKPIEVVYSREGKQAEVTVTPERDKTETMVFNEKLELTGEMKIQSKLGVRFGFEHVNISFGDAVSKAIRKPFEAIAGMWSMISKPSTIKDQVGGPVAIYQMTRGSLDEGLARVISFAGLLSIMLGIFNLLPIVGVLDGGHMCVSFVEMLRRGRRLSFKVQNAIAGVGLVTILFVFCSVMYIDISRNISANQAKKKAAVEKQQTPNNSTVK